MVRVSECANEAQLIWNHCAQLMTQDVFQTFPGASVNESCCLTVKRFCYYPQAPGISKFQILTRVHNW